MKPLTTLSRGCEEGGVRNLRPLPLTSMTSGELVKSRKVTSSPSTLSAFLFLALHIANFKLALFSFRIEESFSMRRSNFSIASGDSLSRMSKFSFAGLLAAAWPFFPGPGREAARIEKFQKSVEVNKRTTKAAEIHSGVLFIQGVSFLIEDESYMFNVTIAPGSCVRANLLRPRQNVGRGSGWTNRLLKRL